MNGAAEAIARGRGTQFDPALVDLFCFRRSSTGSRDAKRSFRAPRVPPSERSTRAGGRPGRARRPFSLALRRA